MHPQKEGHYVCRDIERGLKVRRASKGFLSYQKGIENYGFWAIWNVGYLKLE